MHFEFEKNVRKDFKRLPVNVRTKLRKAFDSKGTFSSKPDIKPLKGRDPWLRLRIGSYRVILRPLTKDELATLETGEKRGFLVARVIHRKDLEKQTRHLK